MIQIAFLDPKLDKCLAGLRRSGKKANLAADRADEIISRLKAGIFPPGQVATVTKHGELRIKGCMKYDLGSGYRLVTLKEGRELYLLYVGTHDECHRWIENNRDLPLNLIAERSEAFAIKPGRERQMEKPPEEFEKEADPDVCDPEIFYDDSELRQIFSGLTGNQD